MTEPDRPDNGTKSDADEALEQQPVAIHDEDAEADENRPSTDADEAPDLTRGTI